MKKVIFGLISFLLVNTSYAQSCLQKIDFRGACYQSGRSATTPTTDLKYRAAVARCANGRFKFVHGSQNACLSKDELSSMAESSCTEAQACTQAAVTKPVAPVLKAPGSSEPPKTPSAPVMRPLDQAKVPTLPTNASVPSSAGDSGKTPTTTLQPQPVKEPSSGSAPAPSTGTSDSSVDRPAASENPPAGGSSQPPATTTQGSSVGIAPNTSDAFSGTFYSVRSKVSINSTGTAAEVIYSDVSATSGAICATSRYVLHLDLTNASNAAFVKTAPSPGTYQTVNLRCPSAPIISAGSKSEAAGPVKVISYTVGCVIDSSLSGGAYTASKCAIP